jgi:transcriptional regulator with XRE-family HTH domain
LRTAAGLTLAEIADEVGVSRQAVGYWEAGSRFPRGVHLKKYLKVLRQFQEGIAP